MSDRLAVFNQGRIEQLGTPIEVYERPASEFVAGFIGVSNLLERGGRRFTIRPEKIHLLADGEQAPEGSHVERGRIEDVVYLGMVTRYHGRARRGRDADRGAPEPRDRGRRSARGPGTDRDRRLAREPDLRHP